MPEPPASLREFRALLPATLPEESFQGSGTLAARGGLRGGKEVADPGAQDHRQRREVLHWVATCPKGKSFGRGEFTGGAEGQGSGSRRAMVRPAW